MKNDLIEIAHVSSPKGLKGHFWITPYGDSFERFLRYTHLIIGRGGEPRKVLSCKAHKHKYEISLEGITDISQAEEIRGESLFITRDQMEELAEGEHYWHDLLGMTVMDEKGNILGKVINIFNAGSNDIYVVDEKKQYYIPATKDVILEISPEKNTIVVDASVLGDLIY